MHKNAIRGWISVKHELPPKDKKVKYRYPCGSTEVGIIDKEFIDKHGITHWNETCWYLFPDEENDT